MEKTHDILSSRTFPDCSPANPVRTLSRSLKKSSQSKSQKRHRCLCLKRESGQPPILFWETDGAWHTELSMLNTSAWLNEENVCSLSQTLQVKVPEKYYLSPKACLGILRRASVRGKELPPVLKAALERQAVQEESA